MAALNYALGASACIAELPMFLQHVNARYVIVHFCCHCYERT